MNAPKAIAIYDNGTTFKMVFDSLSYIVLWKNKISGIYYKLGKGYLFLNKPFYNIIGFNQVEILPTTTIDEASFDSLIDILDEISLTIGLPVAVANYEDAVITGGGEVDKLVNVSKIYNYLNRNNLIDDVMVLVSPFMGAITTPNSGVTVVEKLFSYDSTPRDAVQADFVLQPLLTGWLVPSETYGMKAIHGVTKIMTHTAFSFNASTAWTAFALINWFGGSNDDVSFIGKGSNIGSILYLRSGGSNVFATGGSNVFAIRGETGGLFEGTADTSVLIGSTNLVSFIYNGVDSVFIYVNGVLFDTIAFNDSFQFASIARGGGNETFSYYGITYLSGVIAGNLSALEPGFGTFFKGLVPNIPSKLYNGNRIMSANLDLAMTPVGNVIANVTDGEGVEVIDVAADRDFSSDTGFWTKTNADVTISGGKANWGGSQGALFGLRRSEFILKGDWVEVSYAIDSISVGKIAPHAGEFPLDIDNGDYYSTPGFKKCYLKGIGSVMPPSDYANLSFLCDVASVTGSIDNVSVKSIGWADSRDFYEWLIDPLKGNVSVYDALKEVAMWCYFDNQTDNGSIYGKLFNGYAMKLLDLDFASTGFGWRVTKNADWSDLDPNVGDNALKIEDDYYWETGNEGTNTSGLTILGSGVRMTGGVFALFNEVAAFWNSDSDLEDMRYGFNIRLTQE